MTALLALCWSCTSGTKVKTAEPSEDIKATQEKVAQLEARLDNIDGRMQRIEKLLEQVFEEMPDSSTVYSVPVAGFPAVGPADAPITIVKAYEFACGYCYRVRQTLDEIVKAYPGKVRIVYKPYIVHADVAVIPAMAVCAADKQGKFVEMTDLIWEKAFLEQDLGEDKINALAKEAGLDMKRYGEDVQSAACLESLRASVENLAGLGVSGTPTFYINGRQLVGAQPYPQFKALIDEELIKADKLVAQGVARKDYYQRIVVEGGKKPD